MATICNDNLFFHNSSNDLRTPCLDTWLNTKHIIPLETADFQPNNRDIIKKTELNDFAGNMERIDRVDAIIKSGNTVTALQENKNNSLP